MILNLTKPLCRTGWLIAATLLPFVFLSVIKVDAQSSHNARLTSDQITIDGQINEAVWELSQPVNKIISGTPDHTVIFDAVWDLEYLYIAGEILDENLTADSPGAPYQDDAFEVFIDADHSESTPYDSFDRQFIQAYNSTGPWGGNAEGVISAWNAISGGFAIEMAIPWSNLGIEPADALVLGFDIIADDDDDGGNRDGQTAWSGDGNNWQSSINFGDLILDASNQCGLLQNSSFENGLQGWSNTANSNITSDANEGENAVISGPLAGGIHYGEFIPVQGGDQFTFSAWAKTSGAVSWSGIGMDILDENNAIIAQPIISISGTSYAEYSFTGDFPLNAVAVDLWTWKAGETGNLLVDDFCLVTEDAPEPYLNVPVNQLNFTAAGGTDTVTIESNSIWQITTPTSWIAINPTSGNGNGEFMVEVNSNQGGVERTGLIQINGAGGNTHIVSINQQAEVSGGIVQNIGVNIGLAGGNVDYNTEKPYADMMRTHRSWDVAVDTDGWPIEDGSVIVAHGLRTGNNHGTYKLRFDCNNPEGVSISENWGSGVISNQSFDGNRVTADLVISDTTNSQMNLTFSNTNGGVRNVTLMRPLVPGSSESYPEGTIWMDQFLKALEPFGTLRYMQWMAGDSPLEHIDWSDRTPWDYATLNPPSLHGWGNRGPAWETVILLANATQTDAWITLPVRATDDYITQLAILFRDGNEHTPPLDPNLKLYVEYGNEIWNTGTYGKQWNYVLNTAITHPECNYDGQADDITQAFRYQGKRTVEISNIFRSVFGDGQMHSRIRPYLGHQKGYYDIVNRTLTFIDRYYGGKDPASTYSDPHPFNYYIYAYGGSTYYYPSGAPPELTIDNIWDTGGFITSNHLQSISTDAYLARNYGVKYIAYEGGQHPRYNGDEEITRIANEDPRMYQKTIDQQRAFNQAGGELNVYYRLSEGIWTGSGNISTGHFGMIYGDIGNLENQPTYNAIETLVQESPVPVSIGYQVPFQVDGKEYHVIDRWGLTPGPGSQTISDGNNYYVGYGFTIPVSGTGFGEISYLNASSAIIQVEVNGIIVDTFNLEGSGMVTTSNFELTNNNLYVIRLIAVSGSLGVESVSVKSVEEQNLRNTPKERGRIKLSPNPAPERVNISLPEEVNQATIQILENRTGKVITELDTTENQITIDTLGMPRGIYIVKVIAGNFSDNELLIVE